MKQIKLLAITLACVFAVGTAFTSTKHAPNGVLFDGKYEYVGTDGAYYILGENLTGMSQGPDTYLCDKSEDNCTVATIAADIVIRNGQTEIPIANSSILELGHCQLQQ